MSSYLISNEDNLYVCDAVSLNKLKISKESKAKVAKVLNISRGEVIEIPKELASSILHKDVTKEVNTTVNHGEVKNCSYPLGYNSMLITNESDDNEIKIIQKNIKVNPFIKIYKNNVVDKQLETITNKHIVIDLEHKDLIRNVWLFKDFEFEATYFHEGMLKFSPDNLKKLDTLSILENKTFYRFFSKSTELIQVPYKVSLSDDSRYYVGSDAMIQDIDASCRNLEIKLEEIHKTSTFIATDRYMGLLDKAAKLIIADAYEKDIENKKVYFNKNFSNAIVANMINEFVIKDKDKITVNIKHYKNVDVYAMRVLIDDEICTQWLYGTDPKELYNNVLEHFYTLYHQNGITFGKATQESYEVIQSVDALPKANTDVFMDMLSKKYKVSLLKFDELLACNIYIFCLTEMEVAHE